MNRTTDLVLVSFLEDYPEGEVFVRSRNNGWPFHVTLVPWFGVSDFAGLDRRLAAYAQKTEPFTIKVGPLKMFGPDQDIPVNVIEEQPIMKQQQDALLAEVLSLGELLDDRWAGKNYHAHITRHLDADDNHHEGEEVLIDHMYLVRMLDDKHCQFLKKYPYGAKYETAT